MKASGQRHDGDGRSHGNTSRKGRVGDQMGNGNAGEGRQRVAADDGPRLRQRACRNRKEQHGGCAERRHKQRKMFGGSRHPTGDEACQANADQRAERGNHPFPDIRSGHARGEGA